MSGFPISEEQQMLVDTVRTPLGPEFADRSPAEVLERGSLRELEFSFDLGADGGPAALSAIAGLASLLEADDPFREYFTRIGPGMLEVDDARVERALQRGVIAIDDPRESHDRALLAHDRHDLHDGSCSAMG